jgi:hypothetical protein
MRYKHVLLLLTFIFTAHFLFAQLPKRKNYFPAWSFHQRNSNISGFSVGLGSLSNSVMNVRSNGIRIEAIGAGIIVPLIPRSPIPTSDTVDVTLPKDKISEVINGINLATTGSVCDCVISGINLGVMGHINYQVNGFTAVVFMNFVQKLNGLQLAMFNDTYQMNGVQLGLFNVGVKTKGLQLGLFNKAKNLQGVQLGLWNVNSKRKLPLLNWGTKK